MPNYGNNLYAETTYKTGSNVPFFLSWLVESLPPPHRDSRDFLERMLLPTAEDLARVNDFLDSIDSYMYPESAPEDWLNWILTEWMGWKLIPEGYPIERKRRLLSNLHLHYKRRHTATGIKELLKEFGVTAQVYDRPLYVGSYVGFYGIPGPLNVRVRVLSIEPAERGRNFFVGGYVGHSYAYRPKPLVTEEFVLALCEWSRAAGVRMFVEFVTRSEKIRVAGLDIQSPIIDDAEITE